MGIWRKVFGGADGCREAMHESYCKHVRLAQQGSIPTTDPPHHVGLYGALGSRYRGRGMAVDESLLWGELAPFLAMPEAEAVEALTEYVLYQERFDDARVTWLKGVINSSLLSCEDRSLILLAVGGWINRVAWRRLLEPETKEVLEDAANASGFSWK